jgi:hypothetical protein
MREGGEGGRGDGEGKEGIGGRRWTRCMAEWGGIRLKRENATNVLLAQREHT